MSTNGEHPKRRKRNKKDLRFDSISLGYRTESSGIGFLQRLQQLPPNDQPVFHRGDEHALVFAPTGKGKGVSHLIPNLLTYTGSAIVVDVKGEAAQVTAQRRREMGQKVYVIDPFHVTTNNPDKFNPLDLHLLNNSSADVDAEMFASMLSTGKRGEDTFWLDTATPLVAGTIAHHLTADDTPDRNFNHVRKLLRDDEFDYTVAKLLDDKKVKSRFACEELASYLQICSDRTRPLRSVDGPNLPTGSLQRRGCRFARIDLFQLGRTHRRRADDDLFRHPSVEARQPSSTDPTLDRHAHAWLVDAREAPSAANTLVAR